MIHILKERKLIVTAYHGTPFDFEDFSMGFLGSHDEGFYGEGLYFTSSLDVAYKAARGGYIITVVLHLNNPFYYDLEWADENVQEFTNYLLNYLPDLKDVATREEIVDMVEYGGGMIGEELLDPSQFTAILKRNGFDGVVVETSFSKQFVVFYLSQVKIIDREKV